MKSFTYINGDPHRVMARGTYQGMTCLEICRKDKESRKWQAWMCNVTRDEQLKADLQKAMIVFLEEHWLQKETGGHKK